MYFHRTVRDHAATVWRRCSVDVVVDRWHCRPDIEGGCVLIRSLKKREHNFYLFFILAKKYIFTALPLSRC